MSKKQKVTTEIVPVENVFKSNFIDYGFEVIKNRALPDVRDGLKPVQRNSMIEYFESNATSKKPHVKVARLSGAIIGKWHPHGDAAVEEAIVNMSQEWKNNACLIEVKGNNGSIYGDPAAAGRYIESRTTPAGDSLGELLSPDIVPYEWNYDDSEQMPVIMPAQIPVLLLNGASGIAVGLACSIPPHNPGELCDTIIQYLKNPKSTTAELLETLHGPDFPTGGVVINKSELLSMYETGKGRLRIRGKMTYSSKEHALHVIEVPFTKSGIVENLIADITTASMETVDKKGKKIPPKIPNISQVENHSGKDGIDIKISLRAGADPEQMKQLLFALTPLEDTMTYDFRALNDHTISRYSLKQYLHEYAEFQQTILIAKYEREKARIERRIEVLSGRIILQKVVNEVIACAKLSNGRAHLETILKTGEKPKGLPKEYHKTVSSFRFTPVQAEDIAGLAIYRISKMDMQAIVDEGKKLQKDLTFVNGMLKSDVKRRNEIIKNHERTKTQYPVERRTKIVDAEFATVSQIETPEVPMYVNMDQYGYIRIQEKSFDGATKVGSKGRMGIFGTDGVLWNLHLSDTKPTTGRGVLSNQLLPGVEPAGFVTLPDTKNGLFIYSDGSMKRGDMSKFMTKSKSTKVASGKIKTDVELVKYVSIPEGAQAVVVNGKTIALDKIPVKSMSATGVKRVEPATDYQVEFNGDIVTSVDDTSESEEMNAWCVFHKDGILTFDWNMDGAKPEGLYVVAYQDLLKQELVVVHNDGTAKRIDGSQFEVKTKRTSIKADKDGAESIYIAPVTETLVATYDTGAIKRVKTSDISKQGKAGGGVRAFYTTKHKLVKITDGKNSTVDIVSLATQPKIVK